MIIKNLISSMYKIIFFGFVSISFIAEVNSASLPDKDKPYPYFIMQQKVEDALHAFGRNLALPVKIDGTIKGKISKFSETKTRRGYLNELSNKHDFIWYFDGAVIYITERNKIESKTLVLEKRRSGEIIEALRDVSLLEDKFINTGDWYSKVVFVSGPPSYVKRISELIKDIDAKMPAELTIIRGNKNSASSSAPSYSAPSSISPLNGLNTIAPEPVIPKIDVPSNFE